MTINLTDIEKKALAATPGPWSIYGATGEGIYIAQHKVLPSGYYELLDYVCPYDIKRHNNAEYIAAVSPDVVLKLIEIIRKQQEALEFYENNKNWIIPAGSGYYSDYLEAKCEIQKDGGERARQTLAWVKGEMG